MLSNRSTELLTEIGIDFLLSPSIAGNVYAQQHAVPAQGLLSMAKAQCSTQSSWLVRK